MAMLLAASGVFALGAVQLGCDGDDGEEEAPNSRSRAEEIAACAEQAGFDPTISKGALEGTTAVDLTTKTATIVLQVFESERDAAAYAPASGLEGEEVGSVVILGGAIPAAERQRIRDCISG
jgi:hypothetical protein